MSGEPYLMAICPDCRKQWDFDLSVPEDADGNALCPECRVAFEAVEVVPAADLREKLLGDKAITALARERFDYLSGYSGTRWEEAHESIRRQEEDKARLFLEAALDAALPGQEEK